MSVYDVGMLLCARACAHAFVWGGHSHMPDVGVGVVLEFQD